MRSAIITAVLAFAYGITVTSAAALVAPAVARQEQCVEVGWMCSADSSGPAPECCEGLTCYLAEGLPVGVSCFVCRVDGIVQ